MSNKKTLLHPNNPEVYNVIIDILVANGFVDNGETIDRRETGCVFYFSTLNKYTTVTDFQLDWPYSK